MQDTIDTTRAGTIPRTPWNKGRLIGQKPPLKLKDLWGIRLHLQLAGRAGSLRLQQEYFERLLERLERAGG